MIHSLYNNNIAINLEQIDDVIMALTFIAYDMHYSNIKIVVFHF